MPMRILLLFLAFAVVGCSPNYMVLMKNPQTGDVKECKRNPLKNFVWEETRVVDECAALYEKAGYQKVQ
ncbi:MAG: hypothetical protein C4542_07340 [Dehalococcoidia bacterium]|nr:MAG: hypothetical protein C4542_07340 [Dehalococcoidia bacterium]